MKRTHPLLLVSAFATMSLPLLAQPKPIYCREFTELLRQPGLKLSVRAQREILLPNEIIEPTLRIENNSDQPLQIPIIDSTTGVAVVGLMRKWNDKYNGYEYQDVRDKLVGAEVFPGEPCAIPQTGLRPGDSIEFSLEAPNRAWLGESPSKISILRIGNPASGEQRFIIQLGYLEIQGKYQVHNVEVESLTCLSDPAVMATTNMSKKDSPKNSCWPVVLLRQDARWFLFAASSQNTITNMNEYKTTFGNKSLNPEGFESMPFYPYYGTVIQSYDTRPEVLSPQFPAIVPFSEFRMSTPQGTLTGSQIREVYRDRHRDFLNRLHP